MAPSFAIPDVAQAHTLLLCIPGKLLRQNPMDDPTTPTAAADGTIVEEGGTNDSQEDAPPTKWGNSAFSVSGV